MRRSIVRSSTTGLDGPENRKTRIETMTASLRQRARTIARARGVFGLNPASRNSRSDDRIGWEERSAIGVEPLNAGVDRPVDKRERTDESWRPQ